MTRREHRIRLRYEKPGDMVVFVEGARHHLSRFFRFMFFWFFILKNKMQERREERDKEREGHIEESFDELMDSATEPTEEDQRFGKIAAQMRGEDSELEREMYIEQRFKQIMLGVVSVLSLIVFVVLMSGAVAALMLFFDSIAPKV